MEMTGNIVTRRAHSRVYETARKFTMTRSMGRLESLHAMGTSSSHSPDVQVGTPSGTSKNSRENAQVEAETLECALKREGIDAETEKPTNGAEEIGKDGEKGDAEKGRKRRPRKAAEKERTEEAENEGAETQDNMVGLTVPAGEQNKYVSSQEDMQSNGEAVKQRADVEKHYVKGGLGIHQVDDPCHLFKCVRDGNGKKARLCLASSECERNPVYFHRRDAIERHLLSKHGILCFIPGGYRFDDEEDRSVGSGLDETDDYEKRRCMKNFYNAEAKYIAARKKFERGVRQKGLQLFNQLPDRLRVLPQNDFIDSFCRTQMNEYDSKKDERMQKINERIAKGYEASTRDGRVHKKQRPSTDDEIDDRIAKDDEASTTGGLLHQLERPNSIDANVDSMGLPNLLPDLVTSQTNPKTQTASVHGGDNEPVGSIEISFSAISRSLNMQSPPIPKRFTVISKRFNLTFSCSDEFLTAVAAPGVMATTMTFNLFIIWLDYMVLPTISTRFWIVDPSWVDTVQPDIMTKIWSYIPATVKTLFVPMRVGEQWTLWTIVNYQENGIPALKGKEGVLYMDPLNNAPIPSIGEQIKHGVKIVWSASGQDEVVLKNALVPIPIPQQPNETDGGYYVMNCIHMMIGECLQGYQAPRFGTRRWFHHEDVLQLKDNLSRWVKWMVGI